MSPIELSPAAKTLLESFREPRRIEEAARMAGLERRQAYVLLAALREIGAVLRCRASFYWRVPIPGEAAGTDILEARILETLGDRAMRIGALAAAVGVPHDELRLVLSSLRKQGHLTRRGLGVYQRTSATPSMHPTGSAIGDQICALLDEPKRPIELRCHFGGSTSRMTAHLQALMRKGRVLRVGPGLYRRA